MLLTYNVDLLYTFDTRMCVYMHAYMHIMYVYICNIYNIYIIVRDNNLYLILTIYIFCFISDKVVISDNKIYIYIYLYIYIIYYI